MKKPWHFETAISRHRTKKYMMTLYFTNLCNRVIINPVQNCVGDCILHSFNHSRSFRVYNEENSCKHLLNIACRGVNKSIQTKSVIWKHVSDWAEPLFSLSLSQISASHLHYNKLLHTVADPRLSLASRDSWQNCHLLDRVIVASSHKCIICRSFYSRAPETVSGWAISHIQSRLSIIYSYFS